MKVNGDTLRKIRINLGLSQAKLAERLFMSEKQISRIERNETQLNIWQFTSYMEILGLPASDFWLLYLETDEYEHYRMYKEVEQLIDQENIEESKVLLENLKQHSIANNPFVRQSIAHMDIIVSDFEKIQAKDFKDIDVTIQQLIIALNIKNFSIENISEYKLTHVDLKIINHIGKGITQWQQSHDF